MDFKLDGDKMNLAMSDMQKICTEMNETYTQFVALLNDITSEDAWEGKSKQTFLAYADLLKQYHQKFTDNDSNNPIKLALDAFKELESNVDSFYSDFEQYKKMEEI